MLFGFHLILSAYGFWLPNDPRGSWSDFVGAWELFRYGPATKVTTRKSVARASHDVALRRAAKSALKYEPVIFTDDQIFTIANGFATAAREGGYLIHACAILPDHTHLVLGPHERPIGQIAGHLKGKASMALRAAGLHPFEKQVEPDGSVPTCWARDYWKVYIYSEDHMHRAVEYVEKNPVKEGRAKQVWDFITPRAI